MTIDRTTSSSRPQSYKVLVTTIAIAMLFSAIVGSSIWFERSAPGFLGVIQERSVVFCFPGILGSMVFSRNIHAFSFERVFFLNTVVYTACFYFPIHWAARRRRARRRKAR